MYSVQSYGRMIRDRLRTDAYLNALRKAIRPGDVVIDIGTGTGYFAVAACRLGAGRVYAIEPSDAILVARQIAEENGCSDRISFHQELSTRLTFPELADVVVSDLRGSLPLHSSHIPSIIDARTRLLKPGGALIPQRDAIYGALFEGPKDYAEHIDLWRDAPLSIRMEAGRRVSINSLQKSSLQPEDLLCDAQLWTSIDYPAVTHPSFHGEMHFTANRSGTAHGVVLWFETVLWDNDGFAVGPYGESTVYGRPFLPFAEPIPLAAGESLPVHLRADLVNDRYVYTWSGKSFRHSTFNADILDPHALRRAGASFVPTLGKDGAVELAILRRMDGATSLDQISAAIAIEFPDLFASRAAAFSRVAAVSLKYSQTKSL